jgi:hypothetical protein
MLLAALASLLLAACGSFAKSASSTSAARSTSGTGNSTSGTGADTKAPRVPTRAQPLPRFVACMRRNGVNLPPSAISGKSGGLNLNLAGVNKTSAQYKAAVAKCAHELLADIRAGKIQVGKIHIGTIHVGKIHLGKLHVKVHVPGLGAGEQSAPGGTPPAGIP